MTPKAIKVACSNCNLRELCMPVDLDDSDMDKIDTLVGFWAAVHFWRCAVHLPAGLARIGNDPA